MTEVRTESQVENENNAAGYRLFWRVGELWPLLERKQKFFNWFTKLCLGQRRRREVISSA